MIHFISCRFMMLYFIDSDMSYSTLKYILIYRTVGGYMDDDEDWLEETNRLAEIINANGESVSLSQTYW